MASSAQARDDANGASESAGPGLCIEIATDQNRSRARIVAFQSKKQVASRIT
jgi:hypothetical protein